MTSAVRIGGRRLAGLLACRDPVEFFELGPLFGRQPPPVELADRFRRRRRWRAFLCPGRLWRDAIAARTPERFEQKADGPVLAFPDRFTQLTFDLTGRFPASKVERRAQFGPGIHEFLELRGIHVEFPGGRADLPGAIDQRVEYLRSGLFQSLAAICFGWGRSCFGRRRGPTQQRDWRVGRFGTG